MNSATRWVLSRAFLPLDQEALPPEDSSAAWVEACRLRLAARIASRAGSDRLSRELGPSYAARFVGAGRQASLQALKAEAMVRLLGEEAARLRLPFAILKGSALQLLRVVPVGSRPQCDLDILLRPEQARLFQDTLRRQSWSQVDGHRTAYHLPPLEKDGWLRLEVHDYLPRVSLGGRTWSTFDELEGSGNLVGVARMGPAVKAPSAPVLAAHALVGHHRVLWGSMADLLDIEDWASAQGLTTLFPHSWVANLVSTQDLQLVRGCVEALRRPAAAGDELRNSLERVEAFVQRQASSGHRSLLVPLAGTPRPLRSVGRRLAARIVVSRAELDRRYGRPQHAIGYVGLQLHRWMEVLWHAISPRRDAGAGDRRTAGSLEVTREDLTAGAEPTTRDDARRGRR